FLRRGGAKCWPVSAAFCRWELFWPIRARAFVRHDRAKNDDSSHVWALRNFARVNRLAVSFGFADRANANNRLDDYLFHRVGGGELGLPNGQRNFPARNSRLRHRNFLRGWNACRRSVCAVAVRLDHWIGI